jgi:hypothetical protein
MIQEEGIYTIRRVDVLPVRGSTNYLYTIKGLEDFKKFYRWIPSGWETVNIGTYASVLVENENVSGTYELDYSEGRDTWKLNLIGNTIFTEKESSIPPAPNTKVATIYMTGNFVPTFPTNWTDNYAIIGEYDGTKNNQIVVEYIKTGYYWVTITQDT